MMEIPTSSSGSSETPERSSSSPSPPSSPSSASKSSASRITPPGSSGGCGSGSVKQAFTSIAENAGLPEASSTSGSKPSPRTRRLGGRLPDRSGRNSNRLDRLT
ncbi:hypothetical protein E0D97_01890 [Oricola cellulosilytica]|uniref:Uncharacterized protein n=1 Tax=Oricola cellulosilytica TaxID=1429082 RepID=A0A4R0PGL5_9HYPH|nr:hypothetical protein E0D97_01890 [Oricola cellulosilytica]